VEATDADIVGRLLAPADDTTETVEDAAPVEEQPALEADEPEAAAELAVEDDTQEEAPEVSEQPQRFRVKVDGQDVEVTLEELTRDYSGQRYIQKGMQEAAAARKQAEQLAQALQAEQARVLQFAETMQKQGVKAAPKPPDPALAQKDPVGYIKDLARYNAENADYQQQQANLNRLAQSQAAAQEAAQAAFLADQVERLKSSIPEIADPVKGPQIRQKLVDAGVKHYGFSEAEVMGVMDARAVQVLHDAARWRELQATKATAKAAPQASRTVTPAASRAEPAQLAFGKLKAQAKASQKDADFVKLLLKT